MVTDRKTIEPLCEQTTCTIIGTATDYHREQGNRRCVSALRTKNKENTTYMFLDPVLEHTY
jgi:hypothetical protein